MKNKGKNAIATLAGGCFWCTEAVFNRVNGVVQVISGYTGGTIKNPSYNEICSGRTGHAEAIQVVYNEKVISYQELLAIFFATHNPTTLNRQGNDVGTQYRSAIFYSDAIQQQQATDFIALLEKTQVFDAPVVTELSKLTTFYPAESDHQEYYERNSKQPYCQIIIEPKLQKLQQLFQHKLK